MGLLVCGFVGWRASCWVGCGSGIWSMGRLDTGSLVQWFGGTASSCVGRLVCGQLQDLSVRRVA